MPFTITAVSDNVGPVTGPVPNGGSTDDTDLAVTLDLTGTGAQAGDRVELYDGPLVVTPLNGYTLTQEDVAADSVTVQTGPLESGTTYNIEAELFRGEARLTTSTNSNAVTVDITGPVVTVTEAPATTIEATSAQGATVDFAATADDAVDDAPTLTYTDQDGDTVQSGQTFAIGTHTITVTATDDAGNQSTDQFSFEVEDTTAPTVSVTTAPTGDIEAISAAGAAVSFAATATDAVDGAPTVTYTDAGGDTVQSGDVFDLGAHTITVTATDAAGNRNADSFSFTVVDTTAPVVAVTSTPDATIEATSGSGATVSFAATASDDVDGAPEVTYTDQDGDTVRSGDTFAVGTYTITAAATDDAGNQSTDEFTFTVVDTTAPTVSVTETPAATIEATSASGTAVSFAATASDAVDGAPTLTYSENGQAIAPGDVFALGTHTITVTATDAAGNQSTDEFGFTVQDTTDPVLDVSAAPTGDIEATSAAGAAVSFAATASDAVDGAPMLTYAENGQPVTSGQTFGLGEHTITVTATDAAGNQSTDEFGFRIVDTTDPMLDVSAAPATVAATSAQGAAVSFAATATDVADAAPTVAYTDAEGDTVQSGDVFAVGIHTITVTATDAAGNQSTDGFTFAVEDTAPAVTVTTTPPATVAATSASGAAVSFAATASDAVDGALAVTYTENGQPVSPGGVFALGTHTVVATATDAKGQDSTHDLTFTVADLTAPVVTVTSAPTAPVAATSAAGAAVSFAATASDAVDGAPTLTYTENGQPVTSGDVFGLGEHTIVATATDAAGNQSTGRFTFAVVDTTAPALTATQSVSGLTGATAATITGTVSALNGVQTVEVYDGDTKLGEAVVTDGSWSYAASGLSDGEHSFTARATDVAGNATSRISAGAAVIVDTTAPQTFTAAESLSGLTAQTALTLSGAVSDTNGVARVELYDTFGGARTPTFLGTATLDGTAWIYDVTGLGDGVHSFAAIATDAAGNASPVPVSAGAGVTVDTTAPDAPVVSGLGARPGATGVAVRGTAEAGSTVTVYQNAAPLGTVTAGSDGTWAVPLAGELQAGTYAFTATATDAVGNLSATSSASTVTVAEPPPAGAEPQTVVLDTGARGIAVTRTETGDLVVNRNGVTQVLRGVDELQFADGRLVFDPEDTASAVSRLYRAGLGRELDQGGLDYWGEAIEGGARLSDLAQGFLASAEGQALYGVDLTDGGFVARLYQNVLGRPGDPEGVAFWTQRLGEGASRAELLAALADSGENRQATASQGVWDLDEGAAQAARLYDAAFGRLPDQNGLTYWAEVINTGRATPQGIAQGFMASPEFQTVYGSLSDTDFVQALYQNTLDRAGDAAGVGYWAEQLGAGLSRAALLVSFSESPEHVARTAADITGSAPGQFGIKLA